MRRARLAAAAVITATGIMLSGCSGSTEASSSSGPAEITFWGWASGYEKSVELWNKSHPDIHVKYEAITDGGAGGYDKMLTAAKAGKAPCLAQVGYETFSSFLAAGVLQDVSSYVEPQKDEFADWVWGNVGVNGKAYGVPVDTAPMAMFYRADLFKKAHIEVPRTWDEFATAAASVKAADPSSRLMNLPTDPYLYGGFAWQGGAPWFGVKDDAWSVSLDSAANGKVAGYWQGLFDRDLVTSHPAFDAALYSAWSKGKVWAEVGPVWSASLIRDNAAGSAGKWDVAPMPRWGTQDAVGNSGGSATAVMKDCARPKEASEFALWMSTDSGSVSNLIASAAILPASKSGLANKALDAPQSYYGGRPVYQLFRQEAAKVSPDWRWGPVMSTTATALGDGLGKVHTKKGTFQDALNSAQKGTVSALRSQGFSVNK
ncbi:extracellular solute-binding protein [Streptomyces sp. Ncost-T10-10d]|uniref:extracellular solute-binding protein n=1 Tax=Streptomyces sp. Ncost-T10-10d TaxID=1839774 RepID=UPI00081F1748|nr:extracellular solute-binding protein [Streptomyces sp. Ncost-T10-10d]SCF57718.1 carbohydrate ABC transporter substrate-binding protein, CUT1 family [Streptomyces sp. Ncost-T10-10d]